MFKGFKKHHPDGYALFTGLAIVMFWRGTWGLMDIYLFPDQEVISYILSILLGILLLLLIDLRLQKIE